MANTSHPVLTPNTPRQTPTDGDLARLQQQLARALRLQQIRAARYRAALIARYGTDAVWVQPPSRRTRELVH